ncbi:MAG: DNA primase, partial [Patescibacteria group bacterium]
MSAPTEEIKAKIDVVDLVGEYVKLTPGGANWKGRCPFHAEKTPSFMVSRDKQIWHCFGCSEGGDIFTFIQKIEGLDFPDALRLLANRAGVAIKQEDPSIASQRTRLLNLNNLAAQYFHRVLRDSQLARGAREYLVKRGVDDLTVDNWQLGYAPDSWDTTSKFLASKGYSEHEIFLAGLSIRREKASGFYDRFRNRLVFPIRDVHGHVIAFSCRALDPESTEAKYINTSQTPLFNKGQVLFGLDQAKTASRESKYVVVVEGNLDVITSHQFGVTPVVATCGTALTEEHVNLIKRYAPTVILSFDQDAAGQKAAERGVAIALRGGLAVKLLTMPSGEDPD